VGEMIIGKRRGCGEDVAAVLGMKRVILVYESDGLYITKIEKGYWATVAPLLEYGLKGSPACRNSS
jgi:hypothetical protein